MKKQKKVRNNTKVWEREIHVRSERKLIFGWNGDSKLIIASSPCHLSPDTNLKNETRVQIFNFSLG